MQFFKASSCPTQFWIYWCGYSICDINDNYLNVCVFMYIYIYIYVCVCVCVKMVSFSTTKGQRY